MPKKEKKTTKILTADKKATSGFRYPTINFSALPKKDVFAYKFEELIPEVLVCDDVFSRNECQLLSENI